MKILDCTLRDGGYYTNWDFDNGIVDTYIKSINNLPIDYIEIGYRNNPSNEYLGKFGYTPLSVIKEIRHKSNKKLDIMLNEKNTKIEDLPVLIGPLVGIIDMIRIAIDPKNFDRAVILAKSVKEMGFEVGFNTMYMSKWKEYDGFIDKLHMLDGVADLFCMVDSFGGVTPEYVREITRLVKSKTKCPLGFHGHNNLQLGLINSIIALEEGVEFIDATVLGMGRGAGNLNIELLLTYLSKNGLEVDFNILGTLISAFQSLLEKYKWGTSLPYMLSGAYSLPQKEVMDWVTNRTYSFNSIVRALDNKRNNIADNARYPIWKTNKKEKVIIIGGGNSVIEHIDAIKEFLKNNTSITIIFATSRHASLFKELMNDKVYCLVGNEAKRLEANITEEEYRDVCVLPPYPRKMGTEIPSYAKNSTFELPEIAFTDTYLDSCTAIALKVAIELEASHVYITGYDGYKGNVLSEKEAILTAENRILFENFIKFTGNRIISLTPSIYNSLTIKSIYQFI